MNLQRVYVQTMRIEAHVQLFFPNIFLVFLYFALIFKILHKKWKIGFWSFFEISEPILWRTQKNSAWKNYFCYNWAKITNKKYDTNISFYFYILDNCEYYLIFEVSFQMYFILQDWIDLLITYNSGLLEDTRELRKIAIWNSCWVHQRPCLFNIFNTLGKFFSFKTYYRFFQA